MKLAHDVQRCTGIKQLNYYLWQCPSSHICERYLQRKEYGSRTPFGDAAMNCTLFIKKGSVGVEE